MRVSGKPITAAEALEAGLIDQIAERDLVAAAAELARAAARPGARLPRTSDLTHKLPQQSRVPGLIEEGHQLARTTDLPIVMAHPSFPWQDEAISVCLHKPQVYIDLSGWSPKYFSPTLVQYANSLLKTKVLFGSDYPMLTPDRWMADFEKVGFKDEVRPLILKENALRLLGLQSSGAPR